MSATVVIPTYNRPGFVVEAVESALAQVGVRSVIVVDDGSTDDSSAVLQQRFGDDPCVRLVHQDNKGRSAARNHGLAHVATDWVMFLDDDDLLPEGAVQVLLAHAADEVVAVTGSRTAFGEGVPRTLIPITSHPGTGMVWRQVLAGWCPGQGQSIIRTRVVREIGGFDERIEVAEDHKLWLDIASRGPVTRIKQSVLDCRQHPSQTPGKGIVGVPAQARFRQAFVERLTGVDRAGGEAAMSAWRAYCRALAARDVGRRTKAVVEYLRMLAASPSVTLSPELRRVFLRGLAGSLRG